MKSMLAVFMFLIGLGVLVAVFYKEDKPKPQLERIKIANVYCTDGSKWKNVEVVVNIIAYDLYRDNKWIARVPNGMCAMLAVE